MGYGQEVALCNVFLTYLVDTASVCDADVPNVHEYQV